LAEHVRSGCRVLPDPTPESLFEHVHVAMPDDLRDQRDAFTAFVSEVSA
jgi:pyruvate dehydrogenase E1 component alpha subunit